MGRWRHGGGCFELERIHLSPPASTKPPKTGYTRYMIWGAWNINLRKQGIRGIWGAWSGNEKCYLTAKSPPRLLHATRSALPRCCLVNIILRVQIYRGYGHIGVYKNKKGDIGFTQRVQVLNNRVLGFWFGVISNYK